MLQLRPEEKRSNASSHQHPRVVHPHLGLAVTKMDWDRARRHAGLPCGTSYNDRMGFSHTRTKPKPFGFPAKHPGACENCHQRFPKGAFVRYNVNSKLVHGRGCPSKPRDL